MRTCPKCKKNIENDKAKFCRYCGSPLPPVQGAQPEQQQKKVGEAMQEMYGQTAYEQDAVLATTATSEPASNAGMSPNHVLGGHHSPASDNGVVLGQGGDQHFSRQAKTSNPKTSHKARAVGCFLGVLVLAASFFYLFMKTSGEKTEDERTESIEELAENERTDGKMELAENERTDGRMVFAVPQQFTCKEKEVEVETGETLTVFTVEDSSGINCTLCSDKQTDLSGETFEEYWINWEAEEDKQFSKTLYDEGVKTVNGYTCRYKISQYDINGVVVYWRFYILFDEETLQCCVASCYDRIASPEYVDEILESVRFKSSR